MLKLRICKESIKTLIFKTDSGVISVHIGNMKILDGFVTLEDAKNAAKRWLIKNEGLQLEA
jgi:hypothetical protein